MKRFAYYILLAACLTIPMISLNSCGGDDNNEEKTIEVKAENLAGTWQVASITKTDEDGNTTKRETIKDLQEQDVFIFRFNSDNTYKGYRVMNYLEQTEEYSLKPGYRYDEGTIALVGNDLQIVGYGMSIPLHINSMTATEMNCTNTLLNQTWILRKAKSDLLQKLAGTWKLSQITGKNNNGDDVKYSTVADFYDYDIYILTFNNDYTYKGYRIQYYDESTGSYTLTAGYRYDDGDFVLLGNDIHVIGYNADLPLHITSVTGTTLTCQYTWGGAQQTWTFTKTSENF